MTTAYQQTPPAAWLNPRRRLQAEAVVDYLRWHGCKITLTAERYDQMRGDFRTEHLDRYQVDQAVDDLWSLGCVEIRPINASVVSVRLLSDDLDRAAKTSNPQNQRESARTFAARMTKAGAA